MSTGLLFTGFRGASALSSDYSNLFFRGKATRITGTGLTFYPADVVGVKKRYQFPPTPTLTVTDDTVAGRYTVEAQRSGCVKLSSATATLVKDNGVFTYTITSPFEPQVFLNTVTPGIVGTVLGIRNSGDLGVNSWPVWRISVLIAFPAGTAEAAILAAISLYCFSKIHSADSAGDHGLATYNAAGQLGYSSNLQPLKIKDFVRITSSNNPSNLSGLIFTRNFSDNPVQSVFSVTKPGFLNVDFARYETKEYPATEERLNNSHYDDWVNRNSDCSATHALFRWIKIKYITGGVSINAAGNELNFSLVAYEYDLDLDYYLNVSHIDFPPGPFGGNQDITKTENFPITIPIISCAEYD